MALLPIMKDDVPLMIGDPLVPAMADEGNECLCCGGEDETDPCSQCPDGLPLTVTLTITGVTAGMGSSCADCPDINGTYVLESDGPFSCAYSLIVPLDAGIPCEFGFYDDIRLFVNVGPTTITGGFYLRIGTTDWEGIGFSQTRSNEDCLPDLSFNKTMSAAGGFRDCDVTGGSTWTLAPPA